MCLKNKRVKRLACLGGWGGGGMGNGVWRMPCGPTNGPTTPDSARDRTVFAATRAAASALTAPHSAFPHFSSTAAFFLSSITFFNSKISSVPTAALLESSCQHTIRSHPAGS